MSRKPSRRKSVNSARHTDAPIANILLVIALPEERDYFHTVINNRSGWDVTTARQHYECFYKSKFGPVRVIIRTLDGMGQVEAVLGTASAIVACTPRLALMVGISGSLAPQTVGLGDVVVSNQAKLYSSDKIASFLPVDGRSSKYIIRDPSDLTPAEAGQILIDKRDRCFDHSFVRYERKIVQSLTTDAILSQVEHGLRSLDLAPLPLDGLPPKFLQYPSSSRSKRYLHMGWILGSHHVVDSEEYRDYLVSKNTDLRFDVHLQNGEINRVRWTNGDLLAVDMESFGLLMCAEKLRTTPTKAGGCAEMMGAIVVRGISDLCVDKGHMDNVTGRSIRELAAKNATAVCLHLIENLNYELL